MPTQTCVGLFSDRRQADAAVEELRRLGTSRDDISVAFQGQEGLDRFHGWDEQGNFRRADQDDAGASPETAATGLAWLAMGAGTMVINPLAAPVIAAGALMGGLANVVADVAVPDEGEQRGITGSLIAHGMTEDEARYHEGRVGEGAYLIAVHDCGRWDASRIRDILLRHGAEDRSGRAASDPTGTHRPSDTRGTS